MLKLGVKQKFEQIDEISQRASGEALIEQQLKNLVTKCEETELKCEIYQKNMYKVVGLDDIFFNLEDYKLSLQTMLTTKYVIPIKQQVIEWQQRVQLIDSNIQEWITMQKTWIYFKNIFQAQDIQLQLKKESDKFAQIDKFYRDLMIKAYKNPQIIHCCTNQELLPKLQASNKILSEIYISLEKYLESIRFAFPRFYILSNDDLLQILSSTLKPDGMQSHFKKIFDNLDQIKFVDEDLQTEVLGMFSSDPIDTPEYVKFNQILFIKQDERVFNI